MKTKIKKAIVFLPLLLAGIVFFACSDDDKKATCGCNSPVVNTASGIEGILKGDKSSYAIHSGGNGPLEGTDYIICNKDVVKFNVPAEGVAVIFDAKLMAYCGAYTDMAPYMAKVTALTLAE